MRTRKLQFVLTLSCILLAVTASAGTPPGQGPCAGSGRLIFTLPNTARVGLDKANLIYHGGPTIISAKVVLLFWGPSFSNPASPDWQYAHTLQAYRDQLGTTPEYKVITQYSGIMLANLGSGTPDGFDASTPPTNVTDSTVRSHVAAYLTTHAFNSSTIYTVVVPKTSYSSSGTSTSCGGPSLAYCSYHGWFSSGGNEVKYIILPYPSCSGCQVSGWTDVQNAEHFLVHEIREAVTDSTRSGWFDSLGNEADDKCAWSPTPFIGTGGYAYQYEWSNVAGGCVKTR